LAQVETLCLGLVFCPGLGCHGGLLAQWCLALRPMATSPSSQGSSPLRSPLSRLAAERSLVNPYTPLTPLAVPPFLEAYGYAAADADTWRVRPGSAEARQSSESCVPAIQLGVSGHEEMDGHTLYTLSCAFILEPLHIEWSIKRRLVQLREELYTNVKLVLGSDYTRHFAATPFAHKGGVPGTTARLDAWFQSLAACINWGGASPSFVALALHYLEAPEPDSRDELVRSLDAASVARGHFGRPCVVQRLDSGCSMKSNLEEACSCAMLDDIELSLDFELAAAFQDRGLADGLVLRFRLPDGSERLVDFGMSNPPLGVDFKKTTPMRVSKVYGLAARLGVQHGWELAGINGTRVLDWLPAEAFQLIKTKVYGTSDKVARTSRSANLNARNMGPDATCSGESAVAAATCSLVLGFLLPDGSEKTVSFMGERPPLGIAFKKKMPITVRKTAAGTASERLGVQEDWIVTTVNGEDISARTDFANVYKLLHAKLSGKAT